LHVNDFAIYRGNVGGRGFKSHSVHFESQRFDPYQNVSLTIFEILL
jgi:hypothetical protein